MLKHNRGDEQGLAVEMADDLGCYTALNCEVSDISLLLQRYSGGGGDFRQKEKEDVTGRRKYLWVGLSRRGKLPLTGGGERGTAEALAKATQLLRRKRGDERD